MADQKLTRSSELQAMSEEDFLKIPEIKECSETKTINVTVNRCHNCNYAIHNGPIFKSIGVDGTAFCKGCGAENRIMGLRVGGLRKVKRD